MRILRNVAAALGIMTLITLAALMGSPQSAAAQEEIEVEPLLQNIRVIQHCGPANDVISVGEQPTGVGSEIGPWNGNEARVTFYPEPGYTFPPGFPAVFYYIDRATPCVVEGLLPPTHAEVCGLPNNDIVTVPAAPEHVTVVNSGEWSAESTWTVTYTPAEGYVLPGDILPEYVFTDSNEPCIVTPIPPPLPTEVCGPDNDIWIMPDQPEGVLVEDTGWVDGTRTIRVNPDEENGYVFLDVTPRSFGIQDANTPCLTDAPVPPVQEEVCGPNNDIVTIPENQPEGVTLDTDSGWVDGERVIIFAIDPAFVTDGPTEFILVDEAIPCEEEPVGKTVTVTFETSDGGSISGVPYALYAPAAAQNIGTEPYAEGVVDDGNQIVFEELIAGQYRLTVDATGYEPVDTVFEVSQETDPQAITINIVALQVGETPVPSPTPEPTVEPTVEPTAEPTVEPTAVPTDAPGDPTPTKVPANPAPTKAPVTGLPDTGSGGHGAGSWYVGSMAVFVLMVVIAVGGRRLQHSG